MPQQAVKFLIEGARYNGDLPVQMRSGSHRPVSIGWMWEVLPLSEKERAHLACGKSAFVVVSFETFVKWQIRRFEMGYVSTFTKLEVQLVEVEPVKVELPTFYLVGES